MKTALPAFAAMIAGLFWVQATHAAPIVPPSIAAGFTNSANTASPAGSNLSAVTDFTAEYPFINYFHMARPWFSAPTDGSAFQDDRPLSVDANGNIKTLGSNQVGRTVLFTGIPADPGLSGKTFNLFYDGEGELSYGNVRVLRQSRGHDVIKLNSINDPEAELTMIVTLMNTNPANPLRNIRLLPSGGICARNPLATVGGAAACPDGDFKSFRTFHKSIAFNPQFLNTIKHYRSLRFMDWMRTNNSNQVDFGTRALPSHQFWSTEKGVPLEVMVALANLMDMDPWFNIPHRASNAYATSFAKVLQAQLEPGRRAYIEYSNEVWNPIFTQTQFATQQGIRQGINVLEGKRDDFAGMLHFYSRRSKQIFNLFQQAMGGVERIRRVMASQAVNNFLTQEILSFENGAEVTDVFAVAPYFGDTIVDSQRRAELLRLGVDGIFDWLLKDNNPILDFGSLASIDRAIGAQMEVLSAFGIPLTSYEGGQHFLAAGPFQFDPALNDLMDAVNRDPRMKTVYLRYLDQWRQRTGNVFHHFVNCDRWSPFGRWGAREFPTQPPSQAPKFSALMTYIANQPLLVLP